MELLRIEGGVPLTGEVRVAGAKNAALPILAATVMVAGRSVIQNVPDLEDVRVMLDILRSLGATVSMSSGTVKVDATSLTSTQVPSHLMQKMRSPMMRELLMTGS
ncbi:UDP-N-acetylglucosamine 1-carboxyvinyltransferase [Alicyclobacillus mali]|uniref:UDP-N-acetylglucosamine 1-carboxyvinyltransferase n=1 Tax=Alicyclobacillus mali (ex Roth et al. 2021) TaxID=1123961 RepID=A0ABS0F2Q0_9BACL|nr:UDP-N-acetylglucosamine 1-carboxyvinyltransferase [Alicyclobacillus mali (ex Roth et al. 2021)]MBF8377568.1 UDP-N-acetylglucosamine 1-carboxyvinyltransferase [Alicyclobacillus mali (ex Roth et al. 2021)]MCL6489098.1 UDP-N-acetylglucosamine 1-carboxyvinyltransferase [Alicyclobacillus mali (ex Roth et al. 2021)]